MKHQVVYVKEPQLLLFSFFVVASASEKMAKLATALCRILLVLAVVGFAAGAMPMRGGGDAKALERLRKERAKWQRSGPDSYIMWMQRSCDCVGDLAGAFVVTVEDGVVEDVRFASGGPMGTPSQDAADSIPTVEGLFDILEEALMDSASSVSVTYNRENGAPDYFLVEGRTPADDFSYTILFVDAPPSTLLERLNDARKLWSDSRSDSYTMRIESFCAECIPGSGGPFIQKVEGDTVVSVERAPGGRRSSRPVPEGLEEPTVDGLFAAIEEAIQTFPEFVKVSYNPDNGVPEEVYLGTPPEIQDGGIEYNVQLVG